MSQRLTINQNNKPIYDIVFEQDFAALPSELEQFQIADKKLCIITDSKVNHLYSEEVCDVLKDKCKEVVVFSFPDGEKSKNLDTVKDIYEFLIQHKFDRKDMLFALGGGVVGDITGFAAATYLRGIDFVQIPTTLLAQVDSSVGGKTGVDFDSDLYQRAVRTGNPCTWLVLRRTAYDACTGRKGRESTCQRIW
mgnify:CR=1 FL=1